MIYSSKNTRRYHGDLPEAESASDGRISEPLGLLVAGVLFGA